MNVIRRVIHFGKDEIIRAVEDDLIKEWRCGRLVAPMSPLDAASTLTMRSLFFIKQAKTFPHTPRMPSQAEFSRMLVYIVGRYHLSPAFPYSNEQVQDFMLARYQEIQHELDGL